MLMYPRLPVLPVNQIMQYLFWLLVSSTFGGVSSWKLATCLSSDFRNVLELFYVASFRLQVLRCVAMADQYPVCESQSSRLNHLKRSRPAMEIRYQISFEIPCNKT
ncbi:unnamed protein product [Malus baccata var. baccata]